MMGKGTIHDKYSSIFAEADPECPCPMRDSHSLAVNVHNRPPVDLPLIGKLTNRLGQELELDQFNYSHEYEPVS